MSRERRLQSYHMLQDRSPFVLASQVAKHVQQTLHNRKLNVILRRYAGWTKGLRAIQDSDPLNTFLPHQPHLQLLIDRRKVASNCSRIHTWRDGGNIFEQRDGVLAWLSLHSPTPSAEKPACYFLCSREFAPLPCSEWVAHARTGSPCIQLQHAHESRKVSGASR